MNTKVKRLFLALTMIITPMLGMANTSTLDTSSNPTVTGGIVWTFTANGTTASITAGNIATITGANVTGNIILPGTVTDNTSGTIYTVTSIKSGTVFNLNTPSTHVGTYSNWQGITHITFPSTLTAIGPWVFSNDDVLDGVTFLNPQGWASLIGIGWGAFNTNTTNNTFKVNGLNLSGCTNFVGSYSNVITAAIFRGRSGVTGALILPVGAQSIENASFASTSLTSVNFNQLTSLTRIESWAFVSTPIGPTVDLSNSSMLVLIDLYAFANTHNMTSVKLPNSLTNIGYNAFNNTALTGDLVVSGNLTNIGYSAFANNKNLRSITFPGSTISMAGYQVFAGDNMLEYIDMKTPTTGTGLTTLSRAAGNTATGAMFSGLPTHTIVYCPDGAISTSPGGLWDTSVSHPDIPNYIYNGGCWSLNIENGVDYFFPHPFESRQAVYRANSNNSVSAPTTPFTFNAGNSYSIYLPYIFQLPTSMGGYSLYYYNKHQNPDPNPPATDDTFVFLKNTTGQFASNTPYIARIEDGSSTASLPDIGTPDVGSTFIRVPASPVGVNHLPTPAPNTSSVTENYWDGSTNAITRKSVTDVNGVTWTIYGTTEQINPTTATTWGTYYFATDATWYPTSGTAGSGYAYPINQFRVFMTPSVPGAAPAKSMFGGFMDSMPTGISNVTNNITNSVETRIYTIDGEYMGKDITTLSKGIYIVNGKKIVK